MTCALDPKSIWDCKRSWRPFMITMPLLLPPCLVQPGFKGAVGVGNIGQ